MLPLSKIKKNLSNNYLTSNWSGEIRFWPWDVLLPESISPDPGIALINCQDVNQAVRKKILTVLNQNNYSKLQSWQLARGDIYIINLPANHRKTLTIPNNLAGSWATLFILAGPNSQTVLIDEHQAANSSFGFTSVFVLLAENSHCDYIIKNKKTPNNFAYQALVETSAKINFYIDAVLAAEHSYHSVVIKHQGNNSQGNIYARYDIGPQTKNYLEFRNNHRRQGSAGEMVIKILARAASRTKVDGWIEIGQPAVKTNSYLREEVLLLSPNATVEAEPNLEILNNSVRASHGATVGFIDQAQLFYLESRGLARVQAQKIIAQGFLNSVFDTIKDQKIKMLLANVCR